jgi:hypothetical protein
MGIGILLLGALLTFAEGSADAQVRPPQSQQGLSIALQKAAPQALSALSAQDVGILLALERAAAQAQDPLLLAQQKGGQKGKGQDKGQKGGKGGKGKGGQGKGKGKG